MELESRLHQLTETLIQKQTMLEALGTEKSSLAFQLERLEQQLKSAQGGAPSGGQAIHMGSLEGAGRRGGVEGQPHVGNETRVTPPPAGEHGLLQLVDFFFNRFLKANICAIVLIMITFNLLGS